MIAQTRGAYCGLVASSLNFALAVVDVFVRIDSIFHLTNSYSFSGFYTASAHVSLKKNATIDISG